MRIASPSFMPPAAQAVTAGRPVPSWVGNATVTLERGPGGDTTHDPDFGGGFRFEDWVRNRALTTVAAFEVFVPGLTENPPADVWKKLDAEIHFRFGGAGPFQTRFANILGQAGPENHNLRYGVDLRAMDPFDPRNAPGVVNAPRQPTPDNRGKQVKMEFYFTVNGAELRPGAGRNYQGTYSLGGS